MSLYQRILGLPVVYNKLRPLLLGGIDMSAVYTALEVGPTDVVLDVGCGTGIALDYLTCFQHYVGFDTDAIALQFARKRAGARRDVDFVGRTLEPRDVEQWKPTVAVLAGLLHHLTDEEASALLEQLKRSPELRRVTTLDVSFFPYQIVNNLLTVFDRGQYPRRPEGYQRLAERAGYHVVQAQRVPSRPGGKTIAYWVMTLEPER